MKQTPKGSRTNHRTQYLTSNDAFTKWDEQSSLYNSQKLMPIAIGNGQQQLTSAHDLVDIKGSHSELVGAVANMELYDPDSNSQSIQKSSREINTYFKGIMMMYEDPEEAAFLLGESENLEKESFDSTVTQEYFLQVNENRTTGQMLMLKKTEPPIHSENERYGSGLSTIKSFKFLAKKHHSVAEDEKLAAEDLSPIKTETPEVLEELDQEVSLDDAQKKPEAVLEPAPSPITDNIKPSNDHTETIDSIQLEEEMIELKIQKLKLLKKKKSKARCGSGQKVLDSKDIVPQKKIIVAKEKEVAKTSPNKNPPKKIEKAEPMKSKRPQSSSIVKISKPSRIRNSQSKTVSIVEDVKSQSTISGKRLLSAKKNQMTQIGEISSLQQLSNGGVSLEDQVQEPAAENDGAHLPKQNSQKVIKYLAYQRSRPKSSQTIIRRNQADQDFERADRYGSTYQLAQNNRTSLDHINIQEDHSKHLNQQKIDPLDITTMQSQLIDQQIKQINKTAMMHRKQMSDLFNLKQMQATKDMFRDSYFASPGAAAQGRNKSGGILKKPSQLSIPDSFSAAELSFKQKKKLLKLNKIQKDFGMKYNSNQSPNNHSGPKNLKRKMRLLSTKATKMSIISQNNFLLKSELENYDELLNQTVNQIITGKKTKFTTPNRTQSVVSQMVTEEQDDLKEQPRRMRSPLPKARISRFCHSKIDEISCQNFLQFIQRYDDNTQKQIIQEALIPDITDENPKLIGPRSALRSALGPRPLQGSIPYSLHKQQANELLMKSQILKEKAEIPVASLPQPPFSAFTPESQDSQKTNPGNLLKNLSGQSKTIESCMV